MRRLLAIMFVMMMILPTIGAVALGHGKDGLQTLSKDDGSVEAPEDVPVTYGHGRLSREYQDISTWRGVNDTSVSVSYLIITTATFVDAAKPLAVWKTQKGLNTAIVTVGSIYAKYTGLDEAQQVHNFLREFRDNNPTFKWLLLLGDTQLVPVRHLFTNASSIDWYMVDSAPSDFYYSALDSSWNLDNDGIWGEAGEVDWYPDVYVGRIPVDTYNEADFNLVKTLKYEKNPTVGNWMRKALLASALYDVPNIEGDYSTRTEHGYYEWWQDNGQEGIDVVESYIPSHMMLETLHDYNVSAEGDPPKYWGGNWSIDDDELDQNTFVNRFQSGQSVIASASHAWVNTVVPYPEDYFSHGIISYEGNGSEVEGTPNWSNKYDEFFYWTDARDIQNGDMLPFWYASACLVGNFTQRPGVPEETFEVFYKNQQGGVIGLISATHGDYRGEQDDFAASDGDTWLLENFFEIFFTEGDHRPGKTLYESKVAYRSHLKDDLGYSNSVMNAGFARDSLFVYNLLGDPEVPVWTDTPDDLTVTLPDKVYTGQSDLTVTVKDAGTGALVKDAMVALWGPTVYTYGTTDAAGKAILHTDAAAPETVDVMVTAHNYDHWTGSLDIHWKPSDLLINQANLTFSNDLVKAGEDVELNAKVYNIGESTATNVLVRFYLGDPISGGTKIGDRTVASIEINSTGTATITWTAADGQNLICAVADPEGVIDEFNEDNNKACKQIEGTSKDLVLWEDHITFEGAFERPVDGMPMVGNNTTVQIKVQVENKGTTSISIAYLRLFDGDPAAGGDRIGITDYRIDDIEAGGSTERIIEWNVSGAGVHEIYAQVDPNDVITEFDENNNQAFAQVYSDLPPNMAPIDDIILQEDDPEGKGYRAVCMYSFIDDPDNTYDSLDIYISANTNPTVNVTLTSDCVDIVPPADFHGFTLVTITVSDGVFEISRTFKVTVEPVNDPPVITNPGRVEAQEDVPVDMIVEAMDLDGDTLTFSDDSDLFNIEPTTGRIYFIPMRDHAGINVVDVTVSDGTLSTKITFIINVNVNNRAPVLNIKEEEWVFEVGKAQRYTFTASDPDGDMLTIKDNFPHGNVSNDKILAYTAQKGHVGKYDVTITVTDGFTNVSKTVTIIVKEKVETPGTVLGNDLTLLVLLLIIILVVVGIIVAAKMRGSRKGRGMEKDEVYDDLYGKDEKRKHMEEEEERREEWKRRRRERDEERERERGHEEESEEVIEEEGARPGTVECPKCGSTKVMDMGEEYMCTRCSKIF